MSGLTAWEHGTSEGDSFMSHTADYAEADRGGADERDGLGVDGQLISHNVWVHGRRTSIRLEAVMWQALHEIADYEDMTIHQVVSAVAVRQHENASLTATLRAFMMAYFRAMARGTGRVNLAETGAVRYQMN
jgi:predicted DNA-binding ribbon-helix-helix protein